jgi:hypothetical protein
VLGSEAQKKEEMSYGIFILNSRYSYKRSFKVINVMLPEICA